MEYFGKLLSLAGGFSFLYKFIKKKDLVSIMFCPSCGSLLRNRSKGPEKNEVYCSCGFVGKSTADQHIKEVFSNQEDNIIVRDPFDPLANFDHICSKCGYTKAKIVQQDIAKAETWSRCESNRVEIVCGKCGFRERQE